MYSFWFGFNMALTHCASGTGSPAFDSIYCPHNLQKHKWIPTLSFKSLRWPQVMKLWMSGLRFKSFKMAAGLFQQISSRHPEFHAPQKKGGFDPTNHRKAASTTGRESKYSHISTPACALKTSSAASHIIFGILMSLLVGLRRICPYRYPDRSAVKTTIIFPCNSRQSWATCHHSNIVLFVVL